MFSNNISVVIIIINDFDENVKEYSKCVFEEEKFTSKKKIKADMLSERLQDVIKAFSKKVNPLYHTKLKIAKKGYKTHSRGCLLI